MALYDRWLALSDEFDRHLSLLFDFVAGRSTIGSTTVFTLEEECLLEGHLSRIWQAWCNFWRETVFESCLGTVDGNGMNVQKHVAAHTREHVSSASKRVKEGRVPCWQGTNTVLRFEPTWGDTDTLEKLIRELSPSNRMQLLSAVSTAHVHAKALQKIRNCAAHLNAETLADLAAMQVGYLSFPVAHPVQALFWIEPSTQDFLIHTAMAELREAALAAIS